MQGQAAHFNKFAPEKIEYGIKRYTNEVRRLYGVIEKTLSDGRQWLAAGQYTIADMANFSWMFVHHIAGQQSIFSALCHSTVIDSSTAETAHFLDMCPPCCRSVV